MLFGKDADQSPTFSESMFLPEVLMTGFQTAEIHSLNNQNRKLVLDKKLLIDKKEVEQKLSIFSIKPLTLTLILFIIGLLITIWDLFRNHHYKLFDSVLLISTGIGGLLVAYMMIFSSHPLVKSNLNILWLNPLNILLGIFMWFPKLRTPIFFYEIINILLLIGGLFSFALSTQIFNLAAFPLIVLLLLRSTSWFVYLKKRMYKRRSVL